MFNAIFNHTGEADLPRLEPANDALLESARVRELVGGPNPKVLTNTYPDLSGQYAMHAGMGPERIVWVIEAFANDDEDFLAFKNKLRQYAAQARGFELLGRHGEKWQNVQLRRFKPTAPPENCLDGAVWCGWRVEFEWVQPSTTVATEYD